MAHNDRFAETEWVDTSKCLVCRAPSAELICSVTCEEIQLFAHREPLMDWSDEYV